MPDMPASYAVLDTETTGLACTDRVIQIAAVRVEQHEVKDSFCTYVDPQTPIPWGITRLTGISDAYVQGAPTAMQAIEQLIAFVGSRVVVGHNISFDVRMLAAECSRSGAQLPAWKTADTLALSRRCFPEEAHHRLSDLCERFQIVNTRAHQALADVMATQQCYERLCPLAAALPAWGGQMRRYPGAEKGRLDLAGWTRSTACDLAGASFCLTGELRHMSRDVAERAIAEQGGTVKSSVSCRVNYLVQAAAFDPCARGGVSAKARKAAELAAQGVPIRILDEEAFLTLLGYVRCHQA